MSASSFDSPGGSPSDVPTILIACETVEDEIRRALASTGLDYPVVWLEGGLHNFPDKLRSRLQEIFYEADSRCRRLVVSLGFCGGGVSGLRTGGYETVLPLADDCLSLMLGSMEARKQVSRPATYFLTAGWMRHESNVVASYEHLVARYGRRKADRINKLMMRNYRRFGLVATGCYDLSEAAEKIRPLADLMEMSVENVGGSDSWLRDLLTGPHDDPSRFLVVPPRSDLNFDSWSDLVMGSPRSSQAPQSAQTSRAVPAAGPAGAPVHP